MSTTLTPPDLDRCQAEKPNRATALTLGGRQRLVRCSERPTVIATENQAGEDGLIGSMSLCDDCSVELVRQLGPSFATLAPIKRDGA